MVESDSFDDHDDETDFGDMVGDLNNEDPIARVFALGRLNNPMRNF